jgi:hypothetical protein
VTKILEEGGTDILEAVAAKYTTAVTAVVATGEEGEFSVATVTSGDGFIWNPVRAIVIDVVVLF